MKLRNLRLLISTVVFLFITSCSIDHDRTVNPKNVQAQGGVDVGNMSSEVGIPGTQASLTFKGNWTATLQENILSLSNSGSSKIEASRSSLDLVAPTQASLKNYLEAKHPEREYQFIEINGLKGVKAMFNGSSDEVYSDIYLVSETHDFIHIWSNLQTTLSGISEGEDIISTVRIKYLGQAIKQPITKTVTLRNTHTNFYSFLGDCFNDYNKDCQGVTLTFNLKRLGLSKGRIIELGPLSEIPFESVKTEDEYLVSPKTKVALSDIYSTFTPKTLIADQRYIDLKVGYIYLVRTKNWPQEDAILKLKIDSHSIESMTITFEKLAELSADLMKNQIKISQENSLKNTSPLDEGIVVLYNSNLSKNRNFESFNFKYSISGDNYLTNDSWDFSVSWLDNAPKITTKDTTHRSEIAGVVSFESKDISKIEKSDFPDPNTYSVTEAKVIPGKTYGIFAHKTGITSRSVYGAVKVLEIDPKGQWIRLKFRRISIAAPETFQTYKKSKECCNIYWYDDQWRYTSHLDTKTQDVFYSSTKGKQIMTMVHFLPGKGGLYNLGNIDDYENIDIESILKNIRKFKTTIEFKEGDLIAVAQENYLVKSLKFVKITKNAPGVYISYKAGFAFEYWAEGKSISELVEMLTTDEGP